MPSSTNLGITAATSALVLSGLIDIVSSACSASLPLWSASACLADRALSAATRLAASTCSILVLVCSALTAAASAAFCAILACSA